MSLSVIILAAGQGTRMKSNTPKVLHPISGLPMIHYSIKAAQNLSDDITVVLYHQADLIQKSINESFNNIKFKIQDHKNFPGTGGAVMNIDVKHERVLVLNGDMPLVTDEALQPLVSCEADIVMSVIELENPFGYGRVIVENGEVQAIVEEKDCTDDQKKIKTVNAGIYVFKQDVLNRYLPKLSNDNAQSEYYLTDIIKMAKDDKLQIKPVWVEEDAFKGVNSRFDLSEAEELMQKRIRKKWMQAGVTMHLPSTIYIDSRVKFSGECILENGVTIHGESVIETSHIKSHTVIEDAEIKNSSCGPMARIRPGSTLIDTHIGNFVEVKKSHLKGVKAGHLSYLGDAQIDEGTNIGAGTITCNYDGIKKYKTKIGKNVFVGSDTQLVAPVTIEDNVIIAAGTTVTKNVKEGSLAISRTPQKSIRDFFYKFFKREE
ncbi:bifunctional UDP-N-acetylglucosamine diphosphorylase/glucosamine-1-phosphate N-acetyltransferase GlmU [Hydrogenimonas thermophila]|uniref:Bifunctional protein GlmU n=1 Tax=Hydrogenimonas thermophila TaxID=223786 RepID=A0A1I5SME8_9BACT|nr:bifunctional UDP-N-acetylglucosamine diphosphorylase/glucosamine-1-phosphate N-acetyltransferase GlmU [Hydrogenimonas thermophila]WOE71023.1 bifunctional UDP-N-acetylglucosamine diphosphorylase/glucosamine-1-phosphate N-acetyltransferase GlmU [Hydrogenimonas thermophila]WOE73541.1 bifunctional UDP-N-acetylglucosamine diphosphorylase/glucosamine-1-phosphate N-acetyltransferase GlmU [Hydrogenimonas thermophila]SFP71821.1 bifunctional UDP-N-acetylglucosamine pyrophosphorylase / Glucosamine-1-pho